MAWWSLGLSRKNKGSYRKTIKILKVFLFLDKIQIIEKLFFNIVTYSYLLLPLTFLITALKTRKTILFFVYGIVFFSLNLLYTNEVYTTSFLKKLYSGSYTLLEYLFFAYILWKELRNRKLKLFVLIISILFVVFLVFYFFNSSLRHIDSVPVGIETILILIFLLFYFYQYFKEVKSHYIYNEPCFWAAFGILIYLGGSFFFNILASQLSQEEMFKYWFLTYIAEIIKNILFVVAMILYTHQPKKTTIEKSMPYLEPDLIN